MNTFLYLPQLQQLLHLHHYHYQCHYEHHLFLEPQLFLPPFFVCISATSPEFRLRKGIFQNELRIYYRGRVILDTGSPPNVCLSIYYKTDLQRRFFEGYVGGLLIILGL